MGYGSVCGWTSVAGTGVLDYSATVDFLDGLICGFFCAWTSVAETGVLDCCSATVDFLDGTVRVLTQVLGPAQGRLHKSTASQGRAPDSGGRWRRVSVEMARCYELPFTRGVTLE